MLVAEQILLLAQSLYLSIYRPGFIICDSSSGIGNAAGTAVRLHIYINRTYFLLLQNQSKDFMTIYWTS